MAFDPDLPATGVTTFGELYAILRANFVGLATPEAWTEFSTIHGWTGTNCAYMKDPMGFVHLRGNAYSGVSPSDSVVYQLPSGYRPTNTEIFLTSKLVTAVYSTYISQGGEISPNDPAQYVCLDGITFKAAVV